LVVAMVGAFVYFGVRGLRVSRSRRTAGDGVFSSSDRFFAEALQVNGGAEKLLGAISDLPPLQPLAIVAPAGNAYEPLLLPMIASITWPRQVGLIQVGDAASQPTDKMLDVLRTDHFAAALFYDLPPPLPDSGGRQAGLMTVVPLSK
jgi:hypothetical protein